MHIIHDLEKFEAPWDSCVLTLGAFDGMHRGHQALVKRLQKRSRRDNRARVLVTYHPHPDIILGKRKNTKVAELFAYEEKLALFQKFDMDAAIFLPFTMDLARMTALRYLKDILIEKLKASHIIIGYDQCFGRGRKGDYKFLKLMSKRYNYKVERISAVKTGGHIISTTLIRDLIRKGDIKTANRLLGHEYFLTGTVVRGDQRGAQLGFPTANLETPETKLIPAVGSYLAVAERGGKHYRAMVNIGFNPTFGSELQTIEAHILDFNENIYGEQIRLYFKSRLRDEQKFDGIDALKAQLAKDKLAAGKISLSLK